MTEPRPMFSDQDATALLSDVYFTLHPELADYLASFSVELDPVLIFDSAKDFLQGYVNYDQAADVSTTFYYYRGVTERLLLWAWIINKTPVSKVGIDDFKKFLRFCASPPENWVGRSAMRRFKRNSEGYYIINRRWRPFSNAVDNPVAKAKALRGIRSVCTQFFHYLEKRQLAIMNPARHIEESFIDSLTERSVSLIGRLERIHLDCLLKAAEKMCEHDGAHERSLFILAMIIFMLVPVRLISGSKSWRPTLGDFQENTVVIYSVVDAGRVFRLQAPDVFSRYFERYLRTRAIAISDRASPDLAVFTTLGGRPGITSRQVRNVIKDISQVAVSMMTQDGFTEQDIALVAAARLDTIRAAAIIVSLQDFGLDNTRSRLGYESLNALQKRCASASQNPFR
ncbi:hypothetical protein QWI18_00420 [Pseudomonas sp. W2Oct36]|uniref:hypothetical protein n=1 Tax=Pseudomonas sp. W2Oct36 TaxID=1215284 RepID=UPI001221B7F6|nr:MAG: hypothetical protein EOP14_02110 [Pseudomonas sp.]